MTTTGWVLIVTALVVALLICVVIVSFAWRTLALFADMVFRAPKWLVVVGFVLFPPAFVAFLIGLIPYSRWVDRTNRELAEGVIETYWAQHPPPERVKGDEALRRSITTQRRKLGYPD
jgi:hypothetical protein